MARKLSGDELIRNLSEAKEVVVKLSKQIGESLSSCGLYESDGYRALIQRKSWQEQSKMPQTHLGFVYKEEVEDQHGYDGSYFMRRLSIQEARDVLAGCNDWDIEEIAPGLKYACPHCLKAHDLIQERKKARIKVGHAKRAITIRGRALLASKENQ